MTVTVQGKNGYSPGVVAGVGVGVAGAFILGALIFFLLRREKKDDEIIQERPFTIGEQKGNPDFAQRVRNINDYEDGARLGMGS